MSLNFNLINLAILFGACQGVILGFFLFFSKEKNKKGGYFLAFFMLALAYNGIETFLWSANFDTSVLGKFIILFELFPPFAFIIGLGPSLYLYTRFLTNPESQLSRPVLLYYTPVLLQLFLRVCIIAYVFLNPTFFHFTLTAATLDDWHRMVSPPVTVIIFWVYLFLAITTFRKFIRSGYTGNLTQAESAVKIRWLKALLIIISINALVWNITIVVSTIFNVEGSIQYYYPLEVLSSVLMYWIAFTGYHRTKIIHIESRKNTAGALDKMATEEIIKCAEAIQHALAVDKLYLDPDLSVNKLADHIQVSPKLISAVLNQYLKKGFSECINTYRIEEVKERLLDPQYSHLTISGMALESGFNSQATFQRAFKNVTGMSPKEFLSAQSQKSA